MELMDYKVFISYLKDYLSPPPKPEEIKKITFTLKDQVFKGIPRQIHNYNKDIEMVAFCLMPNHYHFLIKSLNQNSMKDFIHSLALRYVRYFNKKYSRIGSLFQGRYKAVLISDDRYLLHLSRYIHLNPHEYTKDITKAYSSYTDYLGLRKTKWVKPDIIFKFFNNKTILEISKINSYKSFVENYKKDSASILRELTLEDD